MNDTLPAIEVRSASVSYDSGRTLTPAPTTFDVPMVRACVAVTGPNGCGKTSLINAILGRQQVYGGSIKLRVGVLKKSAVAYQSNGIVPSITMFKNLALSGANRGEIESELSKVGMSDTLDKDAASLSGGEKRLAQLIRTKISGRPYWFLDEPTAEVDLQRSPYVSAAILEHCSNGGVVVCATHDDHLIDHLATNCSASHIDFKLVRLERHTQDDFHNSSDRVDSGIVC
jgi:heme exporter protein A